MEYRPCLLLDKRSCIEVDMGKPKRRRLSAVLFPTGGNDFLLNPVELWSTRAFCDAIVHCDGRDFPVHRVVLTAASPVFKEAFSSSHMTEAITARLDIKAPVEAVETMLKFIYTGQMDGRLAASVLPLAHRFQLDALVARCADDILEDITPENVAPAVAALRLFQDDKVLGQAWKDLCEAVHCNTHLVSAVLEGRIANDMTTRAHDLEEEIDRSQGEKQYVEARLAQLEEENARLRRESRELQARTGPSSTAITKQIYFSEPVASHDCLQTPNKGSVAIAMARALAGSAREKASMFLTSPRELWQSPLKFKNYVVA